MKMIRFFLGFLTLALLTSCGRQSLEDFREEGEGITRSLTQELRSIHSRDELILHFPRLKKHFDELVNVMISAREFQEKYPKSIEVPLEKGNHDISDRLRVELNRIYQIEGGRELVEKAQEQALNRLDAFEKRMASRQAKQH